MKTKLLIEQHFHGCFGIDFNTAAVDDVLYLSKEILKYGVGGIFPTLVTDSVENIKRQIRIIKTAAQKQTSDMAHILGIHLEGIFINPLKKGIHDEKLFLALTAENFKLIEDDFIKIITLAPELDQGLIKYLKNIKGIKIQAGHCIGGDLTGCSGVTHIFNAMEGISHKKPSAALSALVNDNIYTEVIADGVHLNDDVLKLVFRSKPADKILLVSDCLPAAKSNLTEMTFAGEKIFYDGQRAASKDGVLAGSAVLLPDIIKLLAQKGLFNPQFIENPYKYHSIDIEGGLEFDEEYNIAGVF
ncbi:MAG: hypothetical protein LBK53_03395 [Heliobacteriaceae bacterium]|nr:hypothetical protein [Heliobacteriaceae bacterium]